MWLKNKTLQKMGGGWFERTGLWLWSGLLMLPISARKPPEIVKLFKRIRKDNRSLMSTFEQYIIYSLAKAQAGRPGAMAEVGVFKGASAKLISEVKGDIPLYLFDTYEGLPESHAADRGVHRVGQYHCSLENVQNYLKGYPNLHYYKGIFPDSAVGVPEQKYSFAHFDVDLYEGTKGCLEYFYPRMIPGGVIISHDYSMLAGVEQAFTEFFADKPERVIDLPTTQCMVIKL